MYDPLPQLHCVARLKVHDAIEHDIIILLITIIIIYSWQDSLVHN